MVHACARFRDDGRVHIESIVRPGSHLISAVAGANALVMAPDSDGLAPGAEVRALILDATQLGADVRAAD
jgi:molybdopterin biosynthesis enzyme